MARAALAFHVLLILVASGCVGMGSTVTQMPQHISVGCGTRDASPLPDPAVEPPSWTAEFEFAADETVNITYPAGAFVATVVVHGGPLASIGPQAPIAAEPEDCPETPFVAQMHALAAGNATVTAWAR